ncbi:MAG: FAD-dependent oxidoreductase, partial [Clostridia bacterium]|nr:FAD-dependent oxidoreductase [Clostridia bacterium]
MKNERTIKTAIVGALLFIALWFGIKPLILGNSLKDYARIREGDFNFAENEYATIVIGSEPEGIASALACSRTGLKTLLITSDSDLGSYMTRSMISAMDPQEGLIAKKQVPLNQGIYSEIFGKFDVGFKSQDYINTVKKLISKEKSLKVITDSYILQAEVEKGAVKGILVRQPDGQHTYTARSYIDATQDGSLLSKCQTPYFTGSEDIGVPDFYMPLEFNFRVSGVDVEALKKSQKASDFKDSFENTLMAYQKSNAAVKIQSPSFIGLNDHELVITGLKVFGVDVQDDQAVQEAYEAAEDEARMLTGFLKTTLTPFKDCKFESGPEAFFVPEHLHYQGRYTLTVADILENRNFKDKIALASAPVDAGKFVNQSVDYIVAKPNAYSIPLGCLVPSNLDNVLMTGSKASFSSLAATSAGSLPTRITVGEAAGLVSAYCTVNNMNPADLLKLPDKELRILDGYLARGGINLPDFNEHILVPKTDKRLSDYWAYPYVKELAEYGLICGGEKNDFKLDYKSSEDVLSVLLQNVIIKLSPESFTLALDGKLSRHEVNELLTGESASEIILDCLSISYNSGQAFEALKQSVGFPTVLTDKLSKEGPVTLDVVYG